MAAKEYVKNNTHCGISATSVCSLMLPHQDAKFGHASKSWLRVSWTHAMQMQMPFYAHAYASQPQFNPF